MTTPGDPPGPEPPPDQARTRVMEQQRPPAPPPGGPRRTLPGGIWPWLVGLLVVVLGGLALAYFLTRGDDNENSTTSNISVPALVGFGRVQAVRQARGVGLRTAVKRVLAQAAVGTVVAQDPQAGQLVPKGTLLVLNVSKGSPPVEVPNLIGLNEAQAGVRLSQVGLEPKVVRVTSAEPSGQVVSQSPQSGEEVKKGSTVTINVSKGGQTPTTTATTSTLTHLTTTVAPPPPPPPPVTPGRITVPNVVGSNLAEAVNTLANKGLLPKPVLVQSNEEPGTIVSQKPAAGARVGAGSSVEIRFAGPG